MDFLFQMNHSLRLYAKCCMHVKIFRMPRYHTGVINLCHKVKKLLRNREIGKFSKIDKVVSFWWGVLSVISATIAFNSFSIAI